MINNIEFRVVIKHTNEAVKYIAIKMGQNHIRTYDLRESSIVDDMTGAVDEDVYIVCCEGKLKDYLNIKSKLNLEEIDYEGYKTLIGKA